MADRRRGESRGVARGADRHATAIGLAIVDAVGDGDACAERRKIVVVKDVCKVVCDPVTTTKAVCKTVPETVCESVVVKGKLTKQCVPVYECAFDPCACGTVQKQTGTKTVWVRECDRVVGFGGGHLFISAHQ